ncbi:MAG: glycosyltransferase [Paludibacteraceae bacterium]|nr:glycosyltransferase [Paludibacteraceae bacterium]
MTLSVVIATYNGARFLREQLDSIYAQTHLPDEVVVSDDGSTDGTLAILEEYKQRYGLKYSVNEGTHGVNANFFRAISQSTGDYIQICDQDDVWLANKLQIHYDTLHQMSQDVPSLVSSWMGHIDANGELMVPLTATSSTADWRDTLMTTSRGQGCTMMFNSALKDRVLEVYYSNPLADTVCYDVLIGFTAAIFGVKNNLGTPLMLYRHHGGNVVDKWGPHSKPFWTKVVDMQTYYPFLQDYRFRELSVVYDLYSSMQMPQDIRTYLQQAQLVHRSTYWKGLYLLLQMTELTGGIKAKLLLLSPIAKTLKWIEQRWVNH